jgi:adenylate cyclase
VASTAVSLAMRATGADRGVLATREEDGGEFVPRVQLTTVGDGAFSAGEVEISQTFVQNAVQKKVAAIARNTWDDVDLSSAKSIVALQIRSILCAPFGDGKDVQGYLYLDSVGAGRMFGLDDLDLVSVIGHHANAQLGRLRLQEKMQAERQRRENLARFLSPDVIRHIEEEAEGGDLDPTLSVREQQATVLFSDIVGFAAISEGMKPPALKRLLDDYFDKMTEILVDRHAGTLDKYIGDAIMALFGAPFSKGVSEDAVRAVSAAVDMRDALEQLRRDRPVEFGKVQFRIGVNTGKVVAGMMGSKRRLEYSVLGDAVNVASRLESSGEPGKILIGEETFAAVQHAFVCESAGERQVKNRARPVKCWWVLRRK